MRSHVFRRFDPVEVIAKHIVAARLSLTVVALAAIVLVVGVGSVMFLVVLVTSLALSGVTLAVTVVDVLT